MHLPNLNLISDQFSVILFETLKSSIFTATARLKLQLKPWIMLISLPKDLTQSVGLYSKDFSVSCFCCRCSNNELTFKNIQQKSAAVRNSTEISYFIANFFAEQTANISPLLKRVSLRNISGYAISLLCKPHFHKKQGQHSSKYQETLERYVIISKLPLLWLV